MTQRNRVAFRWLGAAVALLLAVGPVLGALHFATAGHVACPEDGELIDAAPAAVQASGNSVQISAESRLIARESGPAGGDHSGLHAHCAIALQAHVRARAASTTRVGGSVAGPPAAAPVMPDPPRLASLAVYRLAPKASPPLV